MIALLGASIFGLANGRNPHRGQGKGVMIDVNFMSETSDKATEQFISKLPAQSTNETCRSLPDPDVEGAAACLGLTDHSLGLRGRFNYPADAESHFLEIERTLARFKQKEVHRPHRAAGFGGPWIENYFISHFENLVYGKTKRGKMKGCLRDTFGPFIPIFLPWVDRWIGNAKAYPSQMVAPLRSLLRKDVLYITVSQNDVGLDRAVDLKQLPNLVVLSAGGYGHVAVPLLKQKEEPLTGKSTPPRQPLDTRFFLASFTGNLGHSPARMRGHMAQVLRNFELTQGLEEPPEAVSGAAVNGNHFVRGDRPGKSLAPTVNISLYSGEAWRDIMASSRVSLCPRGYGRTSYHLSEAIQMGLVPVHVWLDQPWVPYPDTIFPAVGYSTNVEGLYGLLAKLGGVTHAGAAADLMAKEAAALKYAESHFTYKGVLEQIALFMMKPSASVGTSKVSWGSDLRCVPLPKDPRAEKYAESLWANSLPGANGKKRRRA